MDDDIVFCKNIKDLNYIKEKLVAEFNVKFYDSFESFLGFNVAMGKETLKLEPSQLHRKIAKGIRYGKCKNAKSALTPI